MIDIEKAKEIKEVLIEIVHILTEDGGIQHFPSMRGYIGDIQYIMDNPDNIETFKGLKHMIKGMYGGMGTFGDYFLSRDHKDSKRFYGLKNQLYKLIDEL